MYLPVFDGKYELIEKLFSDDNSSTWLVKASGSTVEFVMLTIKDSEVATTVSTVLKKKSSPVPRNIVDWQVQDFTLNLICEKNDSEEPFSGGKKLSSYLDKAEASRLLLKSFIPFEGEDVSYQALLTTEPALRHQEEHGYEVQFPLNIPVPGDLNRTTVCKNVSCHLNRIFSPGIDKESHLYYNAAPPEVLGLLGRFERNEIKSLSDLYYAYTHSGFYRMFGDPDQIHEEIGKPTVYRVRRENRSSAESSAEVGTSATGRTSRQRKEKKKNGLFGKKMEKPLTTPKEVAEKHIHDIGARNFNSTLARPSMNSRGMRHLKTLRRVKVAVVLILFLVATPLAAHATGADKWITHNFKKTGLGGAILNTEPTAAFAPDTGKITVDTPITFINQSVDHDPNDSIASSKWTITYKDVVLYESQEMHMLYSFPSEGKYTISLVVEDTRGKTSKEKSITYHVSKPVTGTEIPGETIK